jgi:hypothetical protein
MKSLLFTIPILIAAAGLRIIGQAAPMIDASLTTLIGNLGVIGVLIWFLWYNTTKSQPQMLEMFSGEISKIRADREMERAASARETTELRNMIMEVLKGMRSAVHDVKDTAQTTMNKVALAKAEMERQ